MGDQLGNYIYLKNDENRVIPIYKNWYIRNEVMAIYHTDEIAELSDFLKSISQNIQSKYKYEIPIPEIHSVQGQ